MKVSAVIPTRGDVDMTPVIASLAWCDEVIVWDNSKRDDLAVYARYAAIAEARNDVILAQDDDAILAPESFDVLLAAHEPGHVACNMPERFRVNYSDSALVGFGALFERSLPAQAFERVGFYGDSVHGNRVLHGGPLPGLDESLFYRTCDVVFTTLTPRILVDVPYTDREFASDAGRMWTTPGHVEERARMLALARRVRDAVPA